MRASGGTLSLVPLVAIAAAVVSTGAAATGAPPAERIGGRVGAVGAATEATSGTAIVSVSLMADGAAAPSAARAAFERLAPLARDADLLERYWLWLKAESGAPAELPLPPIGVEDLASNARMALFYPTPRERDEPLRIAVSPRAMARARGGERLAVLGELAHELVHYVLLLRQHGWEDGRFWFERATHGHCDAEFRRLNVHVAEIVWSAYHSNDAVRTIEQMVQIACWEGGHGVTAPGGY